MTAKPELHETRAKYGNLFLDHVTRRRARRPDVRAEGRKSIFNFAYPNLYLVTSDGTSVLLTHGHYFEAYWALGSDWLMHAAGDGIRLETPGEPNLQELVGMNLPLNQLACTGVGQAEPLTAFIRRIQRDVENGRLSELARTLDRLETHVLNRRNNISRMRRAAERYVLRRLKRWILSALAGHEHARYSRLFLSRPQVRNRFCRYFRYSLNEISQLSRDHGIDIPLPSDVVFGHTHQPIPWGARELVDEIDGRTVQFCNTDGWVSKDNAERTFVGAEVVIYETGRGIWSQSVRSGDLVEQTQLVPAS